MHKGYKMKKKAIILTDDEKIQYQDYINNGGAIARYAIWAYVEENEPIPNELKPYINMTEFKRALVPDLESARMIANKYNILTCDDFFVSL